MTKVLHLISCNFLQYILLLILILCVLGINLGLKKTFRSTSFIVRLCWDSTHSSVKMQPKL